MRNILARRENMGLRDPFPPKGLQVMESLAVADSQSFLGHIAEGTRIRGGTFCTTVSHADVATSTTTRVLRTG